MAPHLAERSKAYASCRSVVGVSGCGSRHPVIRKGHVMSKYEKEANNMFRPSDKPLTEYEQEQKALRENLERLRAERLAREKAKPKDD
jgi:hypothetical protein